MNSKLLKVCAAVVMIAGAENASCQGGGKLVDGDVEMSNSQDDSTQQGNVTKKRKLDGWGDSVSARVKGKIEAFVKVRSGENEKELNLFKLDGSLTDESERTFSFEVLCLGANGTVEVKGEEGMEYLDKGVWKIFSKEYGGKNSKDAPYVRALLEMYDESNNRVTFNENSNIVQITRGGDFGKKVVWKLILKPYSLNENTAKGTYSGGLRVVVTANG